MRMPFHNFITIPIRLFVIRWNDHLKSNKKVISNIDIIFISSSKMASITIKSIYKAVNFFLKKNLGNF
jgi:hypothetical protein